MKTSPRPNASRPLLAASLAVLIAFGCSDQGAEPPTSPVATPDLSARAGWPSASQQDLGPALAAQKRHGDRLMAIAGVVGHGVGLVDGEPGIKVFLLKPGVAGVPSRLDDVPVAVEVTGMFVADDLNDPKTGERPAPNGFSIGHPDITAGTLSAIVKDGSGVCYALSNNHVLANSNDATADPVGSGGDSSLQPGPFDGGQDPEHAIATLANFKPIAFNGDANDIDAAISRIISTDYITGKTPPPPYAYGAPGTTIVPAKGKLAVKKFGRTTGLTCGTVDVTSVDVNICYECSGPFCFHCKQVARFTNLVSIPDNTATDCNGTSADFSAGGDSGSLIVTQNGNDPTAHLFAGSSTRTLATQIDPVLSYFGVVVEPNPNSINCTNGGGGGDPGNDPPTANDIPASGDEDTPIAWTPNVSDPNGDGLSCSIAGQPSDGSATVALDCSSGMYTPDANFNGTDAFTYAVSDGSLSGQGTVTVTVQPVNDQPVAQDNSHSTTEDTQLTVSAPGVLGNDSDVDGDVLSASVVTDPSNGSLTLNADGSFTYTPNVGFTGDDPFVYSASDGSLSDEATVTITVSAAGSAEDLHVENLFSNSINNGSTWTAVVTILIYDNTGAPVEGASVVGIWNGAGSGSGDCTTTTDVNGQCTVQRAGIQKRNGSVTYSDIDVQHTLTYDSNDNVETSIVVNKP